MQVGTAADTTNIVSALRNAAAATGSDFNYLLGTAMRESSLKPGAQSSSSSATGLFQFIDQTWLGLVKDHGAKYGMAKMADAIKVDSDGRYRAATEKDRNAILELRKDPKVAGLMAGEYSKASAAQLESALGRSVCGGELYAAHFLGPDGAWKLIRAAESKPGASAAALLPHAAEVNKSVFYHADGSAKSVGEVYGWATQQPGATAPVRAPDETQNAWVRAASASSTNIESLLASVMNWQPSHNFFSPGAAATAFSGASYSTSYGNEGPSSPLMLTPGLLDVLSQG